MTVHLEAGQFEVSTNGIILRKGWKLRGTGIDKTMVQLAANNNFNDNGLKFDVIGGKDSADFNPYNPIDGAEVSDLTVDCNFKNETGTAADGVNCVEAVGLDGSDTRISRVKAINWGTHSPTNECFVLYIGFSHTPPEDATNCVIEDCIVTQPAATVWGTNTCATGITVDGDSADRSLAYPYIQGAVIRNNLVENITTGGTNQPAWFHGYTATTGTIIHNYASNLFNADGIYRDTYNGTNVLIDGNVMNNVSDCIRFEMLQYHLDGLIIKNNYLRPAENGIGIAYYTDAAQTSYGLFDANAFVTNFVIERNIIYASTSAINVSALSLGNRTSVSILNNVLQGKGHGADLLLNFPRRNPQPHTLKIESWSGNVNMMGYRLILTNATF
jgi:hypothetical protein